MSPRAWTAVALLLLVSSFAGLRWASSAQAIPPRESHPGTFSLPPTAPGPQPAPETDSEALLRISRPDAAPAGRAAFTLAVGDWICPYDVTSAFVLPGEELGLSVPATEVGGRRLGARADAGELVRRGEAEWSWRAPEEPGLYPLAVVDLDTGESTRLHAFVLRPYHGRESLNGFRIGRYERIPLRNDPVYERPRGFVEVTSDLLDTPLSPHFRLGQFLCKQSSAFPKYVALREPLLLKLEEILEQVRDSGVEADTLHVMSGFRTPWYNAHIGNSTRYSRHGYGDAADIFVDEDGDGRMDDLDDDGRVDLQDARYLYDLVEGLHFADHDPPLVGGLGLYGPAPHRGPFVHVDVRGFRARW